MVSLNVVSWKVLEKHVWTPCCTIIFCTEQFLRFLKKHAKLQTKILVGQKTKSNKQPKQHKLGYSGDNLLLCFFCSSWIIESKTHQTINSPKRSEVCLVRVVVATMLPGRKGSHKTGNNMTSHWKRKAGKIGFWRDWIYHQTACYSKNGLLESLAKQRWSSISCILS